MESSNLEHHKRFEYCHTRLQYRRSKMLTAVKVYTIANESCHLLIFGVPKINLYNELKRNLEKYGPLASLEQVTQSFVRNASKIDFEIEQFTDIFHAKFEKLENARRAKKFYDARNFYGGILHISYAPELESNDDIRKKLIQRRKEIAYRSKINAQEKKKKTGNEVCHSPVAKRPKFNSL